MLIPAPPAIVCPVEYDHPAATSDFDQSGDDLREMDLALTAMHPDVARIINAAKWTLATNGESTEAMRELYQSVRVFKSY